jgi:L-amino acid N-acyltransferase
MKLVDCTLAQHGAAIVGNLNEVIENSTAVYDYVPRSPATMEPWFATKTASRFPVIGAEDGDGDLLGFATYATFRAWPRTIYGREFGYLRPDARRQRRTWIRQDHESATPASGDEPPQKPRRPSSRGARRP